MRLEEIVRTSVALAETPRRLAKIELLAGCLRRLRPDEMPVSVAYLSEAGASAEGVSRSVRTNRPAWI